MNGIENINRISTNETLSILRKPNIKEDHANVIKNLLG